jgi:hypothetical protein
VSSVWYCGTSYGTSLGALPGVFGGFSSLRTLRRCLRESLYSHNEEVIQDVNWPAIGKSADSPPYQNASLLQNIRQVCVGLANSWQGGNNEKLQTVRDGSGVDQIWLQSLESLKTWMDKQDTDPDLSTLLIDMLQAWRTESAFHGNMPYGLNLLAIRQLE